MATGDILEKPLEFEYRVLRIDTSRGNKPCKLDEWDFRLSWPYQTEDDAWSGIAEHGKAYNVYTVVKCTKEVK